MTSPMRTTHTHASLEHWRLRRDVDNLAWLTFDRAGHSTNALSHATLEELGKVLDILAAELPAGLIIQSGKTDSFIVGADIHAFAELEDAAAASAFVALGWNIFDRLAHVPYPTLALINGTCLGGGLELALACTRRIVIDSPKTTMGLPEVMLGIVPGWGGMRRLPQTIGAPAALDMMLSGRNIDASRAVRMKLADFKVAPRLAEISAQRHVTTKRAPARERGLGAWLNMPLLKSISAWRARKTVDRRDPYHHYDAPRAIIDIWSRHHGNPLQAQEVVEQLFTSATTRNLLRVFHLQERLKSLARPRPLHADAVPVRTPARIHIVGAGVMGGDIAAWCALKGLTVTLQDTDSKRVGEALGRAHTLFLRRLRQPLLVRNALDRLIPDPQGHGISRADIVLEAIVEDGDAKRALYREIEPRMLPDAVLATNTSSLALVDLLPALHTPQRLVGIHFFNPVAQLPLVEVVASECSGDSYLVRARALVGALSKLPLPVKDVPGFLVNAVLAPYMQEAIRCVDEGLAPESVDAAMLAFGMPMGPIELADKVGLDIVLAAGRQLTGAEHAPAALMRLVEQGNLGAKTGRGFYPWRDGRAVKNGTGRSDVALSTRLLEPLVKQARKQLDARVVEDADLVDAAMIFGAGYAPFTGGPLHSQNS